MFSAAVQSTRLFCCIHTNCVECALSLDARAGGRTTSRRRYGFWRETRDITAELRSKEWEFPQGYRESKIVPSCHGILYSRENQIGIFGPVPKGLVEGCTFQVEADSFVVKSWNGQHKKQIEDRRMESGAEDHTLYIKTKSIISVPFKLQSAQSYLTPASSK